MSAASEDTAAAMAKGNADYETKMGFRYIVCATGKTAEEMLAILQVPTARRNQIQQLAPLIHVELETRFDAFACMMRLLFRFPSALPFMGAALLWTAAVPCSRQRLPREHARSCLPLWAVSSILMFVSCCLPAGTHQQHSRAGAGERRRYSTLSAGLTALYGVILAFYGINAAVFGVRAAISGVNGAIFLECVPPWCVTRAGACSGTEQDHAPAPEQAAR